MTVVLVRSPAPRDMAFDLYTDITTAPLLNVTWSPPDLRLEFDGTLTAAQVALVKLRTQAIDNDTESLLKAAANALQGNSDYLALTAPDNLAVRQQVNRLTRQASNLIRDRLNLTGLD